MLDAEVKSKADEIKTALLEQLYMPVRWVDCINSMHGMQVK